MENYNKVKNDQLGMSFGKANQILRKMILFSLVQETGRDICFKCEDKIDSIDELSIEHKKPWLYISAALFWDLDNIAFSHRACNKPDRPNLLGRHLIGKPAFTRKTLDNDKAWCGGCQQVKIKTEFSKNNSNWNGLQDHCKDCRQTRYRVRGV